MKLKMNTLESQANAKKKLKGYNPTVFIQNIRCVAEDEKFIFATTLRLVDLQGLPRDNTMGPLNTRSLTSLCHQARERAPSSRKGKF